MEAKTGIELLLLLLVGVVAAYSIYTIVWAVHTRRRAAKRTKRFMFQAADNSTRFALYTGVAGLLACCIALPSVLL